MNGNGASPLRAMLEKAAAEQGCPLQALTVLAKANDPFRVDTPARHRDGEWLAVTAAELGLGDRKIHLRGLHYMVIGRPKPDGTPYTNTDKDWTWLQEDASKAARWLGYLPWDQVIDQRNAPPEIREFTPPAPGAYLATGIEVVIPEDVSPTLRYHGFRGVQPCKLVMFGEKSSLDDVLGPLAEEYESDVYLPTGEISDTLLYTMAVAGARDGRPMTVLCFSDCDPSGWQMPISIGRKLQAFKATLFGDLEFTVHRVALTPDQVREHGLPSTPLKATEKRADRWRQAMGVDQTEIDSLASLRPDLLEQIARRALDGFYDHTLARRVETYRDEWLARAWQVFDSGDREWLARVRHDAESRLAAMREEIDQLNDALRVDVDPDELPPIELPQAADPGGDGLPLLDSRWEFAEQCRRLMESKGYLDGEAGR